MSSPSLAASLSGCIAALREAEAHIRATAYDFGGGERQHHLQAADKAKKALNDLASASARQVAASQQEKP